MMEDSARTGSGLNELLASRKAEEAAWRRFQAAEWLQGLVGPLGLPSHPSEEEFVSRLRNGMVLCNAINKVHPGAVPKVVESHPPLSLTRESQPLPAYQYFENVKNFLVAVEEMKLPAFEASDLERDTLESGSGPKVVDCILALKHYHECKQTNGGNGFHKPIRSPMVLRSARWNNSGPMSSESCRRLDMRVASEKQLPSENVDIQKLEDLLVKTLAEHVANAKENIDGNLLASFPFSNMDQVKLFNWIILNCLEEKVQNKFPELKSMFKDCLKESSDSTVHSTTIPLQELSENGDSKCCRVCFKKGNCNHKRLFQMQQKELLDLKMLLKTTKREFADLQFQLESDLRELDIQVQEMSTAALGYQRVLKENRNLYNMVQDLKGNIRVYCRIRPIFTAETRNVIDYVGEDGSLVILDPSKPRKEGRKIFQFNRVFGPAATQDEVFEDTRPLIRSVMDGYNVCIFAYGQTGSGKTYTMSGASGGSSKDMGINYLALNDLFHMSNVRRDVMNYVIQVQMVEIYNEQVRDLLAEDSSASKLEIRSCTGDHGLSLPDAKLHPVKSTDDVLNLMKLGEMNRVFCSTAMNSRSSRSHSVLTVHVHGKDASGSTLHSCLHLVDLAGSERVDKSEVTGDRLKEAQYINKSLSCLGDVITALSQKNSHIPYRNSKLTLLLQDSLGGHAKTLMFAHVSPEGSSFGESVSTLKFAQRVSTVELGVARANRESGEIMQLKEQVESLQKQLERKDQQNVQFEKPKATLERTPPRVRRLSIESGSNVKSDKKINLEKPKATPERTPPRARRLSIENGSNMKSENKVTLEKLKAMTERTPPHARRLSIENGSNVKSERKTNLEKPKAMTERTPPRAQRLSAENGSDVKFEKKTCVEERKGLKTPSTTTRSRRLSLEGPKYCNKDNIYAKMRENECSAMRFDTVRLQKHSQSQDAEAVTKPYTLSANRSSTMEVYHLNAPRSPTSSSYSKQMLKTASRTLIPHLQQPTTPDPQVPARNEVQNGMLSELTLSTDAQSINLINSANGKGSQIRKSLRTIGKLINGSEKRNQKNSKETQSPINGMSTNNNAAESPFASDNARTIRRQSLNGDQTSGYDYQSRRSSLGGKKPIDSGKYKQLRNTINPTEFHV